MKKVWLVWHTDDNAPTEEEEFEKLIGVYSSKELAQEAIERLRDKPGFRDYPERWKIDDWDLDEDEWLEGFATVRNGEVL
jgi:hypothetical protein